MSDNLQPVPMPVPPVMTPAVQASADERAADVAREQRTASLVAGNEAHIAAEKKQREDGVSRAQKREAAAKDTNAEPRLHKIVRFEAGTVHDLLEHFKAWVDWRIAGGQSAKPGISAEGVMDEPTRLAAAQRLGLSSRATQAEIEALDPSVGVMDEHKRLAEAQRLGLSSRATPEEIAAAIEASRNPPAA